MSLDPDSRYSENLITKQNFILGEICAIQFSNFNLPPAFYPAAGLETIFSLISHVEEHRVGSGCTSSG